MYSTCTVHVYPVQRIHNSSGYVYIRGEMRSILNNNVDIEFVWKQKIPTCTVCKCTHCLMEHATLHRHLCTTGYYF